MTNQKWVFPPLPLPSNKEPRNALGLWILMPGRGFVFNLGLSPEHAGLSPKIGREEMWRGGWGGGGGGGGDCG